jgi:hypothetical protein
MAIVLSDNIQVNAPKPVDSRYLNILVPYSSTTAANTAIVSGVRFKGLTVNINNDEYWYRTGITNTDLVIKLGGGSAITGAINGLSVSNNNVVLGGTLLSATTINGIGQTLNINVNDLNLTGTTVDITGIVTLQSTPASGSTTDYIIVWNSSDKQLKRVSSIQTNIVNVCNVSVQYTATTTNSFIGVSGTTCIFLMSNPSTGQKISIADICGCALSNNIVINAGAGKKINDCQCSTINTNYGSITFIYNGHCWSAVAFTN